jgi:hypothetical protein
MVIQVLVLHAGCQYLIVYRNSCGSIKDFDQLELEKGPRADQHFILLPHFGGHADLTVLHQLGIFTELDDSVGTYWTPDAINYTKAVTRAQIQMLCWQQQQLTLLEILEMVEYLLTCKVNRVITQVLTRWAGLLLVEISTWEDADQVLRKLTSTTAWGQAVFQGGGNVIVQAKTR